VKILFQPVVPSHSQAYIPPGWLVVIPVSGGVLGLLNLHFIHNAQPGEKPAHPESMGRNIQFTEKQRA